MAIKRKSLKGFFWQFLVVTAGSLVFTFLLWISLLSLLTMSGGIKPANEDEIQVEQWVKQIEKSGQIEITKIPSNVTYALFSTDGTLLESTMSTEQLKHAEQLLNGQDVKASSSSGRNQYKKIETHTENCIIHYEIKARFASSLLQKIFPNVEMIILITFIIILVLDVCLVIGHYAKKLGSRVAVMQQVAEQIKEKNLDFTVPQTGVNEFDEVLDSLRELKEHLAISLTEQWKLQLQKKEQMSALAHDIKTPLTIINGNAQLLQESSLDMEQQDYTSAILNSTMQVQNYVTQIIEITKDQKSVQEKKKVATDEFIFRIQQNVEALCKDKHISLVVEKTELPDDIIIEAETLMRAIMNLFDNAVQFSPKGGTIVWNIIVEKKEGEQGQYLLFQISDEGNGFSVEALTHATEEFYQADMSRGSHLHYGMGLYIVNKIAHSCSGTLELKNQKNKGAVVSLRVPI